MQKRHTKCNELCQRNLELKNLELIELTNVAKGIQSTMNLFQEFGTFNTCTNPNIFPYIFNLATQHLFFIFYFFLKKNLWWGILASLELWCESYRLLNHFFSLKINK